MSEKKGQQEGRTTATGRVARQPQIVCLPPYFVYITLVNLP